jgi:hypothetical protein
MPANLITLAHRSVSAAISVANSDGKVTSGVPARSRMRYLTLFSASAALISALSFSTMSAGLRKSKAGAERQRGGAARPAILPPFWKTETPGTGSCPGTVFEPDNYCRAPLA